MSKSENARRSSMQGHAGYPGIKIAIVLSAIAAVFAVVFLTGTKSSNASPAMERNTRARAPSLSTKKLASVAYRLRKRLTRSSRISRRLRIVLKICR